MSKVTRRTALTGGIAAVAAPICPSKTDASQVDENPEFARGYHEAMRDVTEFLNKLEAERTDDPVVAMCDQWWSVTKQWEDYCDEHDELGAEEDTIWDARRVIFESLSQTQAISTSGAVAQLKVLQRDQVDSFEDDAKRLVSTILIGLEARSGDAGTEKTVKASNSVDGA